MSSAKSQPGGVPNGGFWLRAEEKPLEERSALTPETAKALVDAGFEVHVEKNPQGVHKCPGRIFKDSEFEA